MYGSLRVSVWGRWPEQAWATPQHQDHTAPTAAPPQPPGPTRRSPALSQCHVHMGMAQEVGTISSRPAAAPLRPEPQLAASNSSSTRELRTRTSELGSCLHSLVRPGYNWGQTITLPQILKFHNDSYDGNVTQVQFWLSYLIHKNKNTYRRTQHFSPQHLGSFPRVF